MLKEKSCRLMMCARTSAVPILVNSTGCNWTGPKAIQALAPLTSLPMTKVRRIKKMDMPKMRYPNSTKSLLSTSRMRMMQMAEIPIQIICRKYSVSTAKKIFFSGLKLAA